MLERTLRLILVLGAGGMGAVAGLIVGRTTDWVPAFPAEPIVTPLPHHVAKYPEGISFRFAMVHDVVHERYYRHGDAYYRERNRRVRQEAKRRAKQQGDGKGDVGYLALLDDLGAGLDHLGEHEEAVRVMRDKYRQQQSQGLSGRELYSTYANLGTFLIHGSISAAIRGDREARERLVEGLGYIRRARDIRPEAFLGCETWQVQAVTFLVAAIDRPGLLLEYDLVGNALQKEIDPLREDCFPRGEAESYREWLRQAVRSEKRLSLEDRHRVRSLITKVGAEQGWAKAVPLAHSDPVAFDEPALGIIGMWRQEGANPHLALALGEIMIRVGQRYLAWCAYERATLLADQFWPDRELQKKFLGHCRRRQKLLEARLGQEERERLRPRFKAELLHGQRAQQQYRLYEETRIGQGTALDDATFYDAFYCELEPIATPLGPWELDVVRPSRRQRNHLPVAVLGSGMMALAWAVMVRVWEGRVKRPLQSPEDRTTNE